METYFYFGVRIIAAAYLIYKLWDVLFNHSLFGFWDRILTNKPKPKNKENEPKKLVRGKVVGRTHKVILTDPRKVELEPVKSIDLEQTDFIGKDEPMEIEDQEGIGYIPSEDELYGDQLPPIDADEHTSGVSYDELSEAADVLQKDTNNIEKKTRAARTMFEIQRSEIFDLLAREESNKLSVEALFTQCIDEDGFPLERVKKVIQFEMTKFV